MNRRFKFEKRRQLFFGVRNETLPVTMRAWGWNPRTSLERAYAFPRVRIAVATLLLESEMARPALRIALESFLVARLPSQRRIIDDL